MEDVNTILVTGYAKVPQGPSMFEIHKNVGIVLKIDKETYIIEDVEVTFIIRLSLWDSFKKLMIGYDLSQGVNPLIESLRQQHVFPSQQVIIALEAVALRYGNFLKL